MNEMKMTRRLALLALALAMPFAAGCSDDDDGGGGVAFLRVYHLSPEPAAALVDVFLDGGLAVPDLAFLDLTPYVPVASGTRTADVAPAGAGLGASVVTLQAALSNGRPYSVLAVGTLMNPDGIELIALEDDPTPPAAGFTRVRVVHGAPAAGGVDVYVTGPSDPLVGGTALIPAFLPGEDSGYLEVPAGDYRVRVVAPAGVDPTSPGAVIAIDTGTLAFGDGVVLTAIAHEAPVGFSAAIAIDN